MNATIITPETAILRSFAANAPQSMANRWDMFGRGWGNTEMIEIHTRAALVALGHEAFTANLLMEEALMCRNAGTEVFYGSHRAAGATWQAGMSIETDAQNRVVVNARNA